MALDADISPRHLSCIETGKSQPSRNMIERLADVLAIPLRERNTLLIAAGYAPIFPETSLDERELAYIQKAIDLILNNQEPYPAFVLNRHWDILRANRAAGRMAEFLIGGSSHSNMLRQFFDPSDLRRVVANWEEVASDLLHHLQTSVANVPTDGAARSLLNEIMQYPALPARWQLREVGQASPLLTVAFVKDGRTLSFFSTLSAFVTARYIAVDELRIECSFPADKQTTELCRSLADSMP